MRPVTTELNPPKGRRLQTGGRAWGPERVALGVSMRELERLSGVDKALLSLAENGRLVPSGEEYQAVTEALRKIREATPAAG